MIRQKDFLFNRGRDALSFALYSAGLRKNDKVCLQAFTCLAVPESILKNGLQPVWIDIDKNTLSINLERIKKAISQNENVKGLILQHTYGMINEEINEIKEFCLQNKICLIEDCCHLPLRKISTKKNYGNYGDFAFYSFENGKPIILGKGGSLIVNNKKYLEKTKIMYKKLKSPNLKMQVSILIMGIIMNYIYRPSLYWFLKRIYRKFSEYKIIPSNFTSLKTTIQEESIYRIKKIGYIQKIFLPLALKAYKKNKIKREQTKMNIYQNSRRLNFCFNEIKLMQDEIMRIAFYVSDKNSLLNKASEKSIEFSDFFNSPIHPLKESAWINVQYKKGSCPNAENAAKKIVTFSILNGITSKEIEKYINFLKGNI